MNTCGVVVFCVGKLFVKDKQYQCWWRKREGSMLFNTRHQFQMSEQRGGRFSVYEVNFPKFSYGNKVMNFMHVKIYFRRRGRLLLPWI